MILYWRCYSFAKPGAEGIYLGAVAAETKTDAEKLARQKWAPAGTLSVISLISWNEKSERQKALYEGRE